MGAIHADQRVYLRDVLSILFRHKKKIMGATIIFTISGILITFAMAPTYRSDAQLLIRLGRENLAVDPTVEGPTVSMVQQRENEINSELSILTSPLLARDVVNELGVDTILTQRNPAKENINEPADKPMLRRAIGVVTGMFPNILTAAGISTSLPPEEEAVRKFMFNMSADVGGKSNIINVSFRAQNPDLAKTALEKLIDFYMERHIQVHAVQASPEFFELQVLQLQKQLEQCEQELADFKTQNGISSIEKQKEELLAQIRDTETNLNDADGQVSASDARIISLQRAIEGRSKTVTLNQTTGRPNYTADSLKLRLDEMRQKEIDLSSRYTEKYPPLIELRKQIAQTEESLSREQATHTEVTTGLDQNYLQLQLALDNEKATYKAQTARSGVLSQNLADQKNKLAKLSSYQTELDRLLRNKELVEDEYKQYRENLQRAKISAALDLDNVSNVSIVQPATYSLKPIAPKKTINLLLSLVLGLFAGITLALAAEYFDDTVRSSDDLERRVNIPVLTTISDKDFKACI